VNQTDELQTFESAILLRDQAWRCAINYSHCSKGATARPRTEPYLIVEAQLCRARQSFNGLWANPKKQSTLAKVYLATQRTIYFQSDRQFSGIHCKLNRLQPSRDGPRNPRLRDMMHLKVDEAPSLLHADRRGLLQVRVIQVLAGHQFEGRRYERRGREFTSTRYADPCREVLRRTTPGALNVISFHRGIIGCQPDLIELSRDRTIVTLAGIDQTAPRNKKLTNDTFIAQDGQLDIRAKLSLASEDQEDAVERGNELRIYLPREEPQAIRWAVLNCHDYTHVNIIAALLRYKIELLVVVAHNPATRLYWEYAISDIHRLFCHIVIVNIGEWGGSGVFAPFRRIGYDKNAEISAAGQIFGIRGKSEIDATIELDFRELRRLRKTFAAKGFKADAIAKEGIGPFTAVVPSEHFMCTFDRPAGPPPVKLVEDVPTAWESRNIRVAIGQLNSMSVPDYVASTYRIRKHPNCRRFLRRLESHLTDLKKRCKLLKTPPGRPKLDVLLLPEVFVPRTYLDRLQSLSNELGATVICGIDYPDGGEETNANECAILRPHTELLKYRKITRSQYDAWRTEKPTTRMPLKPRGDTMYRFVNSQGEGFGVLVCYDYSHFDLIHKINLEGRPEPLDVLFVVAHNPFGLLYRSCCIADSHRFYQYIVMCNVSEFGGSGAFGPVRTPGARQTIVEVGKGTEAIALAELDIGGLREARRKTDHELHKKEFMRRPGLFQDTIIDGTLPQVSE
jgi:predicted amidohydrolase